MPSDNRYLVIFALVLAILVKAGSVGALMLFLTPVFTGAAMLVTLVLLSRVFTFLGQVFGETDDDSLVVIGLLYTMYALLTLINKVFEIRSPLPEMVFFLASGLTAVTFLKAILSA